MICLEGTLELFPLFACLLRCLQWLLAATGKILKQMILCMLRAHAPTFAFQCSRVTLILNCSHLYHIFTEKGADYVKWGKKAQKP